MNIASTSKKIRRWNGDSNLCIVDEPTVEATIAILRGLKERYEVHHGVRIQDCGARGGGDACRIAISPIGFCRTRRWI